MGAKRSDSVRQGIGLCFLLHLLQIPLLFSTEAVFVWFLGITQLAYVVPAAVMLLVRGRVRTMSGVFAGAGITAAGNAIVLALVAAKHGGL